MLFGKDRVTKHKQTVLAKDAWCNILDQRWFPISGKGATCTLRRVPENLPKVIVSPSVGWRQRPELVLICKIYREHSTILATFICVFGITGHPQPDQGISCEVQQASCSAKVLKFGKDLQIAECDLPLFEANP